MDFIKELLQSHWFIGAIIVLGGILLGIIFEKVVIHRIRKLVRATKFEWDDILISSLKGVFIILFTIASLYFAAQVVDIDASTESIVEKVIIALLIFSLTVLLARAASGFIKYYSLKTKSGLPATSLLANIASLIVVITGIVIILQNLGISITPLITALGIGGLAVALALQDTLSNLFAGFQIIVSKQFLPGDFIALESGEEGYVTDVKWRNTTIRSVRSSREIIIPNSKVASSIVTNYNLPKTLMWLRIPVGVAYDSNLDHVEKVTKEVADSIVKEYYPEHFEHKPVVRFKEFGDSSINLSTRLPLNVYIDQFKIRSAFIKKLHKRYNEEGIEIPFPIRTVYMKNNSDDKEEN